ncbi:alpha/beta fold hydrolase [Streptomyces sp. NPDC004542]|uniref:alpha/beta fold hydrolase n=1 Tax=Streptomyces sp. NPDC004542 TaxID=3154281 RepID=UPI00339EF58D
MTGDSGTAALPEIGRTLKIGSVAVNYHDTGDGTPVLLVHGSGPGVTAWANWRPVIPTLAERHRVIAPDMVGFGYTEAPVVRFDLDLWVEQLVGMLDALGLDRVHVVGNSFGGAVALNLAARAPERVRDVVLMGPVGIRFPITDGLEAVWGYEPSIPSMGHLVRDVFVADSSAITDDLVELRYRASVRPGVQERFAALFPAPRQRWVDALALPEDELRRLAARVLVLHGIDDRVIPVEASRRLVEILPDAELREIERCGHWVQIEHTGRFLDLVQDFFARTDGA